MLLPLAAAADPEGAARIVGEHREIDGLTRSLRDASTTAAGRREALQALGELLDDHVRFEERGFFQRVQERLDAEAIARLGRALEKHRSDRGFAPSCPLPPR